MNLTIVSFARGRTGYEDAEKEFVRRLSGHGTVTLEIIRQWRDTDGLPARLLTNTYPVGLYIDGRSYTSVELSAHVGDLLQRGQSHLVFAIGGADGMPAGVDNEVRERWSLSSLTFSHGLARLLLLETLYRSFDMLRGGNYHK
ncbi:MAG: 23S rRNA (pseudouridine(1915)-N(3))-methyltransferase RlmH [bacterium]|nr:23S rRNA (pseudouridine(1915)-N(3))-methyltransferase RlmH [bacterium]